MNILQKVLALLFSLALALSLASCAQGKVNEERLPGGTQGGSAPAGGVQPPSGNGSQEPDPITLDDFIDVKDNTFKDNCLELSDGQGTVLFTVTSAGLYDSLEAAGISEESYAVLGKEKYDHYVKIDMIVKNVDVSDAGEQYNVNNFRLAGHVYFEYQTLVWFSLGGQADDEERAYFHFYLPPAGETKEISVAFGLSDSELAAFRESDGIWLTYNIPTLQRLKLEGLL